MQKINKEIKRLEEKELTLDDLADDDNTYTLLDRYKKKFVQVWGKLCEVTGRSTTTGRHTEKRFKCEGKSQRFLSKIKLCCFAVAAFNTMVTMLIKIHITVQLSESVQIQLTLVQNLKIATCSRFFFFYIKCEGISQMTFGCCSFFSYSLSRNQQEN